MGSKEGENILVEKKIFSQIKLPGVAWRAERRARREEIFSGLVDLGPWVSDDLLLEISEYLIKEEGLRTLGLGKTEELKEKVQNDRLLFNLCRPLESELWREHGRKSVFSLPENSNLGTIKSLRPYVPLRPAWQTNVMLAAIHTGQNIKKTVNVIGKISKGIISRV